LLVQLERDGELARRRLNGEPTRADDLGQVGEELPAVLHEARQRVTGGVEAAREGEGRRPPGGPSPRKGWWLGRLGVPPHLGAEPASVLLESLDRDKEAPEEGPDAERAGAVTGRAMRSEWGRRIGSQPGRRIGSQPGRRIGSR
jgi:hypothetical protein